MMRKSSYTIQNGFGEEEDDRMGFVQWLWRILLILFTLGLIGVGVAVMTLVIINDTKPPEITTTTTQYTTTGWSTATHATRSSTVTSTKSALSTVTQTSSTISSPTRTTTTTKATTTASSATTTTTARTTTATTKRTTTETRTTRVDKTTTHSPSTSMAVSTTGEIVSTTTMSSQNILVFYAGPEAYVIDDQYPDRHFEPRFHFDPRINIGASCSFVWHGQMWIFGGDRDGSSNSNTQQMALVDNCELKRVGDLPFAMNFGTCTTVMDERIFMCFDQLDSRQCFHTDKLCLNDEPSVCLPNDKWLTQSSLFSHAQTRIASNKDKLFAFGSAAKANIQANNKAEQWTVIHGKIERDEVQSYPFSTTISKAPIIAFSDGFITFGGAGDAGLMDIVALMRGGVWEQIGKLAEPNAGHAVIEATPSEFLMVGGERPNTEKCVVTDGKIICTIFNTIEILSIAVNYPELFLVEDDYCK